MLNLQLEQRVLLCHNTIPPRPAVVVELEQESCQVMFLTTSGHVSFARFWLNNGLNCGNNAYWITDTEMPETNLQKFQKWWKEIGARQMRENNHWLQ